MGFTPQFLDLNADARQDLITGSYDGEVYWFQATEEGFLPGENLAQEGDTVLHSDSWWISNHWSYSTASFGDFTNDGLQDLITGGRSLRISKNIGTIRAPAFGTREFLLDTDGNPLKVYEFPPDVLLEKQKQTAESYQNGLPFDVAGDYGLSPYVVDWDQDGLLDVLATNTYLHEGLPTVSFFKGVKTNDAYRFQKGVPLFTAKNGNKAFPGSGPRVFVTDWNSDGVNDLLIGVSIMTMNHEINNQLSWSWESESVYGAAKSPSLTAGSIPEKQLQEYKQEIKLPGGITLEDYMTIRSQGHVYVMLGSKAEMMPVGETKSRKNKAKK
jgi:hypothetical protein